MSAINIDAEAPEDRAVTVRELRGFVRARAKEARLWQALDQAMDDLGEVRRLVNQTSADLGALAAEEEKARAAVADAHAEAARIAAEAKAAAADVMDDAANHKAIAEGQVRRGEQIVADANIQAAIIIETAKAEAGRIMALIDELRGKSA